MTNTYELLESNEITMITTTMILIGAILFRLLLDADIVKRSV